jgi:Arc/MetJ-type ribon-helix-helix transcriptional regulator
MNMNVRLFGASELVLERLIELGYFKSKNEAIRVGLFELAKEYKVLPTKQEIEDYLVARRMDRAMRDIKSGKTRVYTASEIKKKYPELAALDSSEK